ncbi:TPA: Crp/Fnr family transcriptional regulator [bacterium]|jgi:CRP/FNR family transcriptional regulator|nr:Crp/Fnr family transcriptional regulator [bacterium]
MECKHHKEHELSCVARVPIFSNLTYDEMLEVAMITTPKTYKKNEVIYSYNDLGGTLYVINDGQVKISRFSLNGKEQVIRTVGPGEFIGEVSLLSSKRHTDNAIALEETTMCIINGDKLKQLMSKYPTIALKVLESISMRLEKAEELIENINNASVEQRLASALLELAHDKKTINLKMSKGELASQLGMTQETLSRKLSMFQDQGLIKLEGQRKIIILDKDELESIKFDSI